MSLGIHDASHQLGIRHEGRDLPTLHPGCKPFTFGRSVKRDLRIGTEPAPDGKLHVSRLAGSVHWADGSWFVRNESLKKPFDVLLDGVAYSVAPSKRAEPTTPVAVGPGGLLICVPDPARDKPHTIELVPAWTLRLHPIDLTAIDPEDEDTPSGSSRLGRRALRVLVVKFLSDEARPGHAIHSNYKVRDRVNELLRPDEKKVTEAGVASLVTRCRNYLVALGATEVDAPDALGVRLLHWGVIRQSDRVLLQPSRLRADPAAALRSATVDDLGIVRAVLGGLSQVDPVAHETASHLLARGHTMADLVELVARTLLPLGASLVADDCAVALVLPACRVGRVLQKLLQDVHDRFGHEVRALCAALVGNPNDMPAHRVCALGVLDRERAQGLGSALIAAVTARCDGLEAPAVMGTVPSGPIDRLCASHGFTPLRQVEPIEGTTLQVMWRESRSPR